MMTLANYGIRSSKHKDSNYAKILSKSLQIRNRAELSMKQHLKSDFRLSIEKRTDILNCISDYYSRVPFNAVIWNKYQTKQCIIDSIILLDSRFDPYLAREAFRSIEEILMNLVYLPWHREFREIYLYSGRFRQSISEPLFGVEELLKAAGFTESKSNPMHMILPNDKMPQVDDSESVISIIFDCLMAQVVLNEIIDIFENCCRIPKQSDVNLNFVNCFSWVQAYFRERCHQTADQSQICIQELLNNITNHLSKLESSPEARDSASSRNSEHVIPARDEIEHSIPIPRSSVSTVRELSPKLTARDRMRDFLSRQQHDEKNLLTLSSDMLRLPQESNPRKVQQIGGKMDSSCDVRSSIRLSNSSDPVRGPLFATKNGYSTNSHQLHSHHDPIRSATTKYNPSFKRFESRNDNEGKLFNSRLNWICGSCTYKNQVNSEICDMCRNKRPSH